MSDDAVEAMLALVAEHERTQTEAVLGKARMEARELIADVYREARGRLRQNILEIRQVMRHEISQAEAGLETARRQHQQRCDFALLEAAWPLLREALAQRWHEAATRRQWVEALACQAFENLPRGEWEVFHPPPWPAQERKRLASELERKLGRAPRLVADAGVSAGLKLCAGGACLDGTLEGMLADRRALEAQLLAELQDQRSRPHGKT